MKNYLAPLMRNIKLIRIIVAIIATSLLSGCAGMIHRLDDAPIQCSPSNAYATAPVLITNLKEDAHHRHYQLPDGRAYSEVNDDEEAQ